MNLSTETKTNSYVSCTAQLLGKESPMS